MDIFRSRLWLSGNQHESETRDVQAHGDHVGRQRNVDAVFIGATERSYATAWRSFAAFARSTDRPHLPADPETIAEYLAALARAGRRSSTILTYLAGIAVYHRAAGFDPPPTSHGVVRVVVRGIRREIGSARSTKDALDRDALVTTVQAIEEDPRGLRDRALLLVGFAAALRRSEISALDVDDVAYVTEGIVLTLPRSKTDQLGEGTRIAIPRAALGGACPVRALVAWLAIGTTRNGPLFRAIDRHGRIGGRLSGRAVAEIIRARAPGDNIGGHSLRRGAATQAHRDGHRLRAVMRLGRWQSATTAQRYIAEAGLWDEAVGLL